jgi:hypothetical protein
MFFQKLFIARKLFSAAILFATLLIVQTAEAAVSLRWDANSESDLAGYRVYYRVKGTTAYGLLGTITAPTATYSAASLPNGTFEFVVTAYDTANNESGYSNMVQAVVGAADTDKDGVADSVDNCPTVANTDQANFDGDAQGNACDTDDDNDTILDASDCAPVDQTKWRMGPFFNDSDRDGIRTSTATEQACYGTSAPIGFTLSTNGPDNCPTVSNANQTNTDRDALGDACDTDDDNDTVLDASDCAPVDANKWRSTNFYSDGDRDGIRNTLAASKICYGTTAPAGYTTAANGPDNCPAVANPTQTDTDKDGAGDACDTVINPDSDGDTVPDNIDCAVSDRTKWRNGNFYADSDRDNIRNTNQVTVICYGSAAPVGYSSNVGPLDNCPLVSNPSQTDTDKDGAGDACDSGVSDPDNDGLSDQQEAQIGTNPRRFDTDGDGVGDGQEITDGTDPLDRGSVLPVLQTTICAEWNGFLDNVWNVYEHVNLSTTALRVSSALYDITGKKVSEKIFTIEPGAQYDLLVHDMNGRIANSYGKVCSSHNGRAGDLDGRMVYYKAGRDGVTMDFAFAMPLSGGRTGEQYVPFNTFQPSFAAEDSANWIANWIQLTNLSDKPVSGRLTFYNMDGSVLGASNITLAAGARADRPGHVFGPMLVGYVAWIPNDLTIPVAMRNVRYLYDNARGANSFDTAFQVEALAGSGHDLVTPLDRTTGSAILEVSNVSSSSSSTKIRIFDAEGMLKKELLINLPAHSSRHIITDEFIPVGSRGVAVVKGAAESTIAVAMTYGRKANGGTAYLYGTAAVEAAGVELRGTYNTFLGQTSRLVITNPGETVEKVSITLTRSNGTELAGGGVQGIVLGEQFDIPPHGMVAIDLSEFEQPNNYGVVTVQATRNGSVAAWILRERGNEFIIPTPVRQ